MPIVLSDAITKSIVGSMNVAIYNLNMAAYYLNVATYYLNMVTSFFTIAIY